MKFATSKEDYLRAEVENVLLAMEHINGRRPKYRLEFFKWLTEFDTESRNYAEKLETKIGVKSFEHFIRGFSENHSTEIN